MPLLLSILLVPAAEPDQPAETMHPVVARWQELVASRPKVRAELRLIEYEEVFQSERHSRGTIVHNGSVDWRYSSDPVPFEPGQKGGRHELATGTSERLTRRGPILMHEDDGGDRLIDAGLESGWLEPWLRLRLGLIESTWIESVDVVETRDDGRVHVRLVPSKSMPLDVADVQLMLHSDGTPSAVRVSAGTSAAVSMYPAWTVSKERWPTGIE